MLMCYSRNSPNVYQAQSWVTRALDPDQFGVPWTDQFRNIDFEAGGKCYLNAVCRGHLGEVAVGPTIDVRDGYDMRARCKGL
jgi:hypothetical protein